MVTRGQRASRVGAVLLVVLFIAGGCLLVSPAPPAYADVQLTDKLSLLGDFRYRYEIDDANDRLEGAAGADVRDRSRIRMRWGFRYQASDRTEVGFRMRTGANSVQSPHQTLGDINNFGSSTVGTSQLFGLDRAYLKMKWLDSGFLWLGKNQAAIWQQNEQYWDADFQAEGVTAGYVLGLGAQGKVKLQGSYYYIAEDNFTGVFQDRAIIPLQAVYQRDLGPASLTLAVGGSPTTVNQDTATPANFPGGNRTYYLYSAQAKFKNLPIPVVIGYEVYHGTGETLGHGAALRVKPLEKLELRLYYYYVPLNSVPLQGAIVQDDFRFSSNFKGFQFVAAYDFTPNFQIDFRAYPQDTIKEGLTTAVAPGLGNYVQQRGDTTRFQTNLNIKF